MELRMSAERMSAVRSELLAWQGKRTGTKRELLSLLGKLIFISRIVRPGTIFTRRLYHTANKLSSLHHKTKLNAETLKDITWWLNISKKWNKKSMFLEDQWINTEKLKLETDSSDIACSGVFGNKWFIKMFNAKEQSKNIAWKELLAINISCALWGNSFKGKKLSIYCDNASIVYAVNKGYSKSKDIMKLVRCLYNLAVTFNFNCRLVYVKSKDNIAADAISRLQFVRFYTDRPSAEESPTEVPERTLKAATDCDA